MPEYPAGSTTLTSLQGLIADGTWHLKLTNTRPGVSRTLDSWSLNITPQVTVTPVASTETSRSTASGDVATTFAIGFPQQQLSGTYTIQLGPDILDQFGDGQDATRARASNVLRDEGQNSPTTTIQYTALNLPDDDPRDHDQHHGPAHPGHRVLEHRRARQLHHRGGPDRGRAERHAGPAQPELTPTTPT